MPPGNGSDFRDFQGKGLNACKGKSLDDECKFEVNGRSIDGKCTEANGTLSCRPETQPRQNRGEMT